MVAKLRSVPAYCHCELKQNGGNVKEREEEKYGDETGMETEGEGESGRDRCTGCTRRTRCVMLGELTHFLRKA